MWMGMGTHSGGRSRTTVPPRTIKTVSVTNEPVDRSLIGTTDSPVHVTCNDIQKQHSHG